MSLTTGQIDTSDHNGLRGVMSIWIVVFHALLNAEYPVNIQGSSLLSMFYLFSGFSLAIGYYSKIVGKPAVKTALDDDQKIMTSNAAATESTPLLVSSTSVGVSSSEQQQALPEATTAQTPPPPPAAPEAPKTLSLLVFMGNRLLRVLPVYYLTMLLSLPTYYAGFTQTGDHTDTLFTIESYFSNIFPTSTWFLYYLGMPFNIPSWTIQTLIGMWIFLPMLLRYFHSKTDSELLQAIVYCFWIQLVIAIGLTNFAIYVLGMGEWHAKCLGRLHPLSRVWCMMMGVIAGILCLRYKKEARMPWLSDAYWFFPFKSAFSSVSDVESSIKWWDAEDYKYLMFNQSFVLVAFTTFIIVTDTISYYVFEYDLSSAIGESTWMQAIVPFAQLNVMVAMVRHQDTENLFSRFLRTSWMQWLGEISMSTYLMHYPIMFLILWARYKFKSLTWPDDFDCSDYTDDDEAYAVCENYYDAMYWPTYSWIYLPILTVFLAHFVYHYIEKPFHKLKF